MENVKKEKIITGSTEIFKIDERDCKIKADIIINQNNSVKISGIVKDCENFPIENALVKLIKLDGLICKVVDTTVADSEGCYEFKVCEPDFDACYKVIAEKTVCCFEKIIEPCFDVCKECEEKCMLKEQIQEMKEEKNCQQDEPHKNECDNFNRKCNWKKCPKM